MIMLTAKENPIQVRNDVNEIARLVQEVIVDIPQNRWDLRNRINPIMLRAYDAQDVYVTMSGEEIYNELAEPLRVVLQDIYNEDTDTDPGIIRRLQEASSLADCVAVTGMAPLPLSSNGTRANDDIYKRLCLAVKAINRVAPNARAKPISTVYKDRRRVQLDLWVDCLKYGPKGLLDLKALVASFRAVSTVLCCFELPAISDLSSRWVERDSGKDDKFMLWSQHVQNQDFWIDRNATLPTNAELIRAIEAAQSSGT